MNRERSRALALRARRIARRETSGRREERGPFDVIGDIHGCLETLRALLAELGFVRAGRWGHRHPRGRRALFLGDYVNRGPAPGGVLSTVHAMVKDGQALAIAGNHEDALLWMLERSGLEPAADGAWFEDGGRFWHLKGEVWAWLGTLPGQLVVDGGALVVAHAGVRSEDVGRDDQQAHDRTLRGAGAKGWERGHDGARHRVVYGHWVQRKGVRRDGRTVGIDTGCGFEGGWLTAWRYPEDAIVSVEMADEDKRRVTRPRTQTGLWGLWAVGRRLN